MIQVQHIHPMLVHFPIVFALVLAVFDIVATARGHSVTGRTAAGNISTSLVILSAGFAIAAYVFGDVALSIAEDGGFSSEVAEVHEGLGLTTAIVLGFWALIRAALWFRNVVLKGGIGAAVPAVALGAAILVLTTAYYGGMLVFDLGVNVAKAATPG